MHFTPFVITAAALAPLCFPWVRRRRRHRSGILAANIAEGSVGAGTGATINACGKATTKARVP